MLAMRGLVFRVRFTTDHSLVEVDGVGDTQPPLLTQPSLTCCPSLKGPMVEFVILTWGLVVNRSTEVGGEIRTSLEISLTTGQGLEVR